MASTIRDTVRRARQSEAVPEPTSPQHGGSLKGSPVAFGIIIAIVIFGTAVVSQFVLHSESVEALKDDIRGNLIRLALASASTLDADGHAKFVDPAQESTPEYREAIEPLGRIQDSNPDIAFVYTCVLRNGRAHFVLDPTEEGDTNGDGIDEKSHIMDPYDEAGPELMHALRTGEPMADEEPYRDRWGTFISGYAPIRTKNGELVGVVGVDLAAEHYVERLAGMQRARDVGIVVAAMVALVCGIVGFALRRAERKVRQTSDSLEREHRLELTAALQRLESAYKVADFSRTRFSQLFDGLPVPCITFDEELRVFEWNRQAVDHFGFGAHDALERPLNEVLGEKLFGEAEKALVTGIFSGEAFLDEEWSDGIRSHLVSGLPLRSPAGNVTGGILTIVDVTEQKIAEARVQTQLQELNVAHASLNNAHQELSFANRRLETLATTDALTGLANPRALYDRLDELVKVAKTGKPFSVVMADVDHFKTFNDRHGHRAGDQILKSVAQLLEKNCREGDLASRYGGEEFCLLLSGATEEVALKVAERMRLDLEQLETEFGRITASFGVCSSRPGLNDAASMIQAADEALYGAKAAGRNRVVAANAKRKAA